MTTYAEVDVAMGRVRAIGSAPWLPVFSHESGLLAVDIGGLVPQPEDGWRYHAGAFLPPVE